ncbi:MAG: (2Fe-2S) ferredoxin domain-containing protein [Thermodesulfobacteriota bacterium]|nr:(2Fe-2S) ferredoxin domain-containing protein [Thermodesulfobacteriota bacterium]
MANLKESPYVCPIFVCTNDREGRSGSCADGNSPSVITMLKREVGRRGWRKKVRVSQSGCMGLCAQGPNVMIYTQQIWFSDVSSDDAGQVISRVEDILEKSVY